MLACYGLAGVGYRAGDQPGAPASEPWPDRPCRRARTSPVVLVDPLTSTALEIHGPLLGLQPFPGVTWALGLQPKQVLHTNAPADGTMELCHSFRLSLVVAQARLPGVSSDFLPVS